MAGTDEAMTNSMQAHMRAMANMTAEQLVATLPTHRHMVTNMLSQMNGEMRNTRMSTDAAWLATIDSVRQDLTRLPEMTKLELKQVMPAHLARLSRVMQIHKGMVTPLSK
jgi:hypothetical protein